MASTKAPESTRPAAGQALKLSPAISARRSKNDLSLISRAGVFDADREIDLALEALQRCDEVSLDAETTALTPWSGASTVNASHLIGGRMKVRDYMQLHGCEMLSSPRMRILSLWPIRWIDSPDPLILTDLRASNVQVDASCRMFAFDLDQVDESRSRELLRGLSGKTWVGTNLAFDLQWIRSVEPLVSPGFLFDVMLMANCYRSGLLYEIHNQMDEGTLSRDNCLPKWNPARSELIRQLLLQQERKTSRSSRDDEDRSGFSLNFLSQALLSEPLDKSYQKPHNWMPSVLSEDHLRYCRSDIRQPVLLARRLLRLHDNTSTEVLIENMKALPGGAAYDIVQKAIPRLVQMQFNGLPVSEPAVREYVRERRAQAGLLLDSVVEQAPELKPYREDLEKAGQGTMALRNALGTALTRLSGVAPPRHERIDAPQLDHRTMCKLYPDLPLRRDLELAKSHLRNADLAMDFLARSRKDEQTGRVHPMTSVLAITLRTTSKEPNSQSTPSRDPGFKRIFKARRGYKIVSIDYSAIEMRIAAVLAMRAYRGLRRLWELAWVLRNARQSQQGLGMAVLRYTTFLDDNIRLGWLFGKPGDVDASGMPYLIDWMLDGEAPLTRKYPYDAQGRLDVLRMSEERPPKGASFDEWRVHYSARLFVLFDRLRRSGAFRERRDDDVLTLVESFRRGIDPHLLTAIKNEVRRGQFDTHGRTPFEYLADLDGSARKVLKKELAEPRRQAKAENFGLLYGMSATGFGDEDGGLYLYGIVQYGLNWTKPEATASKDGWLLMFPEIHLWQTLTRLRSRRNAIVSFSKGSKPLRRTSHDDDAAIPGKIWASTTLSAREVVASNPGTVMNYCDQGSGAEIALHACGQFPDHVMERLVNFVHDEYVFEVEEERAVSFAEEVSAIMEKSAKAFLFDVFGHPQAQPWSCPIESEYVIDDHWSH